MSKSLRRLDIKLGRLRRNQRPFLGTWGTVAGRFSQPTIQTLTYADLKQTLEVIGPHVSPVKPLELTEAQFKTLERIVQTTGIPIPPNPCHSFLGIPYVVTRKSQLGVITSESS